MLKVKLNTYTAIATFTAYYSSVDTLGSLVKGNFLKHSSHS